MTTMMLHRLDLYSKAPEMQLDEVFADSFMDAVTNITFSTEDDMFSRALVSHPEATEPKPISLKECHSFTASESLSESTNSQHDDTLSSAIVTPTSTKEPTAAKVNRNTLDDLQSKWYAQQHVAPRQKAADAENCSLPGTKQGQRTASSGLPPSKSSERRASHGCALHIALRTAGPRAKVALVRSVAHAAPGALRVRDARGRTPLMVALSSRAPRDVVLALLREFPPAAAAPDRRRSLPVHVAVQHRYDVEIVRALARVDPQSTTCGRDFHGRTALDLALQVTGASIGPDSADGVVEYLQGLAFERLEREVLDV